MRRQRPLRISYWDRPFQRVFPRAALLVQVAAVVARGLALLVAGLWPYRRELMLAAGFGYAWSQVGRLVPGWWSLPVTAILAGGLIGVGPVRRRLGGWLRCGRTRRWLIAGLDQTRTANPAGRLPRIRRVRATAIGERVWLRLRPGQAIESLDPRAEELRAALRSHDVRLTRDPDRAHLITLDVVRRDTLSGGPIGWADQNMPRLSIWDPVHWGISELGTPVRLSLVERAVLIGGNRGAGKSSGITVFVAHAAKSPDVELLLIDANRVQLSPWQDRALMFAAHHPDDAIDVVRAWRDQIDIRLDLLTAMPGMPLALTAEISHTYGLPMWLLVIDELAYHTSVAGTAAQQREFYTLLRDGVARGRAAGMAAIVATQRPTHDLIPTSLRDLFDIRIAYRTMTRTSSDVILGDEFARNGYSATDIDLTARGVAWLLAEGHQPIRTKTAWIPPEIRAQLAVSTIGNRPDAQPHPRPTPAGLDDLENP